MTFIAVVVVIAAMVLFVGTFWTTDPVAADRRSNGVMVLGFVSLVLMVVRWLA